MLFALIASGLWILNSLYSIGYMRGNQEAHQTRFYVCFALALAATMGIALAGNLFTLFVFYELLTLITYPLVTHHGTQRGACRRPCVPGPADGHVDRVPAAGAGVRLARRRHDRLHPGWHPGRQARRGRSGRPARAVHVRHRQGCADALSPLAAGRDGGADAGVGAAACGGRGQGRRVQRRQGHRLRVRCRQPGQHGQRERRGLADRRRRLHDRGRLGGGAAAPTT